MRVPAHNTIESKGHYANCQKRANRTGYYSLLVVHSLNLKAKLIFSASDKLAWNLFTLISSRFGFGRLPVIQNTPWENQYTYPAVDPPRTHPSAGEGSYPTVG
jgi:hypothetical protein